MMPTTPLPDCRSLRSQSLVGDVEVEVVLAEALRTSSTLRSLKCVPMLRAFGFSSCWKSLLLRTAEPRMEGTCLSDSTRMAQALGKNTSLTRLWCALRARHCPLACWLYDARRLHWQVEQPVSARAGRGAAGQSVGDE